MGVTRCRRGRAAALLAVLLAEGACSPSPTPPSTDAGKADHVDAPSCGIPFLGDPSMPVAMQLTARGADGTSSPIMDGSTVALIFPPQGGRVIFAGVRAINLDPCAVQLSGALRDLTNREVRVDVRTVNLTPAPDGWGTSTDANISTFANVPVCPNEWATTDAYGNPFDLIVNVTDRGGRMAQQTIQVTMACAEPDRAAECLCICKGGYMLGEPCGDGGAVDVGSDAPADGALE